jgi:hypothetical protein
MMNIGLQKCQRRNTDLVAQICIPISVGYLFGTQLQAIAD